MVCSIASWYKYRKAFLDNLPNVDAKGVIVKAILGVIIGISVSILPTLGILSLESFKNLSSSNNFVISKLIQDVTLLTIFLLLFYKGSYKKIRNQLSQVNANKSYVVSIGILILLFLITTSIFVFLTRNINLDPSQVGEIENFYSQNITLNYLWKSLLGIFFLTIVAFFEEFIFRFTIYRHLRKKSILLALVFSSLLFSLAHGNIAIPFSFIFGIIIALHYEFTNNFTRTFVIHALHNYLNVYYAPYVAYMLLR